MKTTIQSVLEQGLANEEATCGRLRARLDDCAAERRTCEGLFAEASQRASDIRAELERFRMRGQGVAGSPVYDTGVCPERGVATLCHNAERRRHFHALKDGIQALGRSHLLDPRLGY